MKSRLLKFVDHLLHPVDLHDPDQVIQEASRLLEKNGNYYQALELLKPLAEGGNPLAQTLTGGIYRELKTLPDHNAEALKWFELASSQGFTLGELNIGIMYMDGLGCVKSAETAAHWFRIAAQKGHPLAQHEMATLIISGALEEATLEEAIHYLQQAIQQNYTPAMNELAKLYEHKSASQEHQKQALELRKTAAALGDTESQLVLGERLYLQAESIQNENEFIRLLEESAHYGYVPALFRLGTIYYGGLGVSPDRQRAASYWLIAAEHGHEESRQSLEQMQHVDRETKTRTMESEIPHIPRIV